VNHLSDRNWVSTRQNDPVQGATSVDSGSGKAGDSTRTQIVSWIEDEHGKAYVEDGLGSRADVLVVTPAYGPKYLRTYADGRWTDNLLALPRK
jgi:Protein of unknown function (DUF3892)